MSKGLIATMTSAGLSPRSPSSRGRKDQAEAGEKKRPDWHTAPGLPRTLNSSIVAQRSGRAFQDGLNSPYLWSPVQVNSHVQKCELSYGIGTYVNTLSTDVNNRTFQGASAHLMRLEPDSSFTTKGSLWCYLVGSNFIVCKGIAVGVCPREHDPENGRSMRIARLPEGHRPAKPLQFAALSREGYDVGGHRAYASNLVTLVVMPDGWILGSSSRNISGAIDLSAVRFCIGKGICLIDEVSLHTCELDGTRMVTLQGTLSERFYAVHSQKPLALLPESCRAPSEMAFIVAGNASGGFHLISLHPTHGFGTGGDLHWRDSIWNHDKINLTGIMFEVAADALEHSTLNTKWGTDSQKIFVEDFQKFLLRRFGSIEEAWVKAFDTDGSGAINFTEFGLGCKAAGFVGNATRLWAALDDDRSGEISLDELTVDPSWFDGYCTEAVELPGMLHG